MVTVGSMLMEKPPQPLLPPMVSAGSRVSTSEQVAFPFSLDSVRLGVTSCFSSLFHGASLIGGDMRKFTSLLISACAVDETVPIIAATALMASARFNDSCALVGAIVSVRVGAVA